MRATGVDPSVVRDWFTRDAELVGIPADRLVELAVIAQRLLRVMAPGELREWLDTPVPALGDRAPLDVLAVGGYEQVARLVSEFESFNVS